MLTEVAGLNGQPVTLGEMAHIRGDRRGSNRYDASQTKAQRNDYLNLILLCPTHHTRIDKRENEAAYPVGLLLEMKRLHEEAITRRLAAREFRTKAEVANAVLPLLAQNRAAFENFGPHSEAARRNPLGGAALQSWMIERAGTIVPNNRLIASFMNATAEMFSAVEQPILAIFAAHVRSYERWVTGETGYEGVVRFPQAFEHLIMEAANAGI
ncbi:MAG: HNH endonuclease [Verrucomicrobiaceae bacterium]|nr:MAG: HNH endonuclease [Verrucomicrobiaceae bacterium]